MDFHNQTAVIVGLAKSGLGAARMLKEHGAYVIISESKPKEKLKEDVLREAENAGYTLRFSDRPDRELLQKAQYLILSPGVPTDLDFVRQARELGLTVWGEVELAFHFCRAPLIGITGTNGKTTTTALTGAIVQAGFPGSEIVGNIGIPFTLKAEEIPENAYGVAELSSFQLETIQDFRPHISAVLNITPDHLNRHKTLRAYIEAKENVFRNQTKEDFCVLNYDDPECRRMGQEIRMRPDGPRVLYFSRLQRIEDGVYLEDGMVMSAIFGRAIPVLSVHDMQIFGPHNEENILAAACCALAAGVPVQTVREAAAAFKGVAHRIEYIRTVDGVPYYNDSKATNTDAALKGLVAMRGPVVLIGGGMDKKIPFDDWTKEMPGRVKKLLLIGETRELIRESAVRNGLNEDQIEFCETLEETVEKAYACAEEGDVVLLSPACASWDMFESFEQRGDLFREYVNRL